MKKWLVWMMAAALACGTWGFLGCDLLDEDGGEPDAVEVPDRGESWTVLVYMVADNDLEPFSLDDLTEMMQVGSSESLNIIVQSDRADGYAREGIAGIDNWMSTKRLKVEAGGLTEIADLGETNMGDPVTLSDFIEWGVTGYPADRYFIVFWDHGAAWPGFGGDESTASLDMLTMAELRSGLSQGLSGAGLDRFDLIGFDACLMASYEAAVTLNGLGDYLLASEELEPGHGWDYASLSTVRSNPALGPVDLAKGIIAGFQAQAIALEQGAQITLSVTDLSKIGDLEVAVEALAAAINQDPGGTSQAAMGSRADTQEFGKAPDPAQSMHMVDLHDLATRLAGTSLAGPAAQVTAALAAAVRHKVQGPAIAEAGGLSIYLPSQMQYYQTDYDSVAGVEEWRAAVKAMLGFLTQDTSGPVFTNPDHEAYVEYVGETLAVSGQLQPGSTADLAATSLLYGVIDQSNGTEYIVGSNQAEVDAGGLVTGYWDETALTLSQGELQSFAFLSLEVDQEGTFYATIPMLYQGPGDETVDQFTYVIWVIGLDGDTGETVLNTYYAVSDAGLGELYPEPGGFLHPIILEADASGQEWAFAADAGFDAVAEIELSMEYLQVDMPFVVYLVAEDLAGNADYVFTAYEGE